MIRFLFDEKFAFVYQGNLWSSFAVARSRRPLMDIGGHQARQACIREPGVLGGATFEG
jgi:hypothetical protein